MFQVDRVEEEAQDDDDSDYGGSSKKKKRGNVDPNYDHEIVPNLSNECVHNYYVSSRQEAEGKR